MNQEYEFVKSAKFANMYNNICFFYPLDKLVIATIPSGYYESTTHTNLLISPSQINEWLHDCIIKPIEKVEPCDYVVVHGFTHMSAPKNPFMLVTDDILTYEHKSNCYRLYISGTEHTNRMFDIDVINDWLSKGYIRPIEATKPTTPTNPLEGLSLADLFDLTKMWFNDEQMTKEESDKFAHAIDEQRMKIYNLIKQQVLNG